jgi:O-antigen/teichoic acid export membrane protein
VLFQVYLLSLVGDTVDFGVSFRLLNITRKFLSAYVGGVIINVTLLVILLPRIGPLGAAIALMSGQYFASFYFGWVQSRLTGVSFARTLGLPVLSRTLLAAALAFPLLLYPTGHDFSDIPLAALSTVLFLVAYVLILRLIGKGMAREMLDEGFARVRRMLPFGQPG